MNVAQEKIMLALDVDSGKEALAWAERMKPFLRWIKVGHQLFLAEGPAILANLQEAGFKIFLDLKFYDIPATVAKAGVEATRHGAAMFNVHALGGIEMMKTCLESCKEFSSQKGIPLPRILAVTLLTSHSRLMVEKEMGLAGPLVFHSTRLAKLAKEAGMSGLITSAMELPVLRKEFGSSFLYVVPGIRPAWSERDDQRRVETPKQALDWGADFIVIGRPILNAPNPEEAITKILYEISAAP
ncbi:MAG TPA: orotidine-5'-phosphate decarboxylase [Nitrospiria bacterium]|nr:orotidine-5'-phosphate decarboxylase [Nitrospiria bacterium]